MGSLRPVPIGTKRSLIYWENIWINVGKAVTSHHYYKTINFIIIMEKKYSWNLPTKEEVINIVESYAEHKLQWQQDVKKRLEEEKLMIVAEDCSVYEKA